MTRVRAPLCGLVIALLAMEAAPPAVAQQSPIAYPAAGQTTQQQAQDEADCRNVATQATGITPSSAPPEYSSSSSGGAVRGAARGAAVGAVGGAIAGDAGKGAAIGAAVGGTAGVLRRSQQRRQDAQVNQQAQAAYQQDLTRYYQSFAACMSSRNYTMR